MSLASMSLAVVGADYPNKRGPARRFDLALCSPGDPIELRLEPDNPADPLAVAVFSERGVQLGYLTAERCGRIGGLIRQGRAIKAIFQRATSSGAVIRVAFDGEDPKLPESPPDDIAGEQEFCPDPDWPEESQE